MSWTPLQAIIALAAALGAAALLAPRWRATLARAHAGAALLALVVLLLAFAGADFSYDYVWQHTKSAYPLAYRLAGVWGGEEGTVLLWSGAVAVFGALVVARERLAGMWLIGFSTALVLVDLLAGAFGATDPAHLAAAPSGRGLADSLLTPLMVIHPPVQFVGYALMAPVAAYALAGLQGASGWAAPAYRWARVAWLFATLGLGLGAIWAYYVLSFGGYWAWDPVETSNLLPWLALTAFLHAGKHHLKFGDFPVAAPVLALSAHLLTLFATFATRSGLWVSVHAFTDPTSRFEPDAAARLLAILDVHAPTRLLMGLLGAEALAFSALVLLRFRPALRAYSFVLLALAGVALVDSRVAWGALFGVARSGIGLAIAGALLVGVPIALAALAQEERASRLRLDARTLMVAAVALLAIATAVALALDVQVVNGAQRSLFDERAPFVALPIAMLLTLMLALAPLGPRGALILVAAGAALGAAGAFLFPGQRVLALSAPILAAGLVAAVLKLRSVMGPPRLAGWLLLLSSLLGLVMWSNPPFGGPWLGALGIALSALAFAGALAAFRRKGFLVAALGALGGALAAGYLVGAPLGVAALGLLVRERAAFEPFRWRSERARLREAGIYLIHVALLLGLLGFAASTYSQEREVFAALKPGEQATVGSHAFVVGAPETAGGSALTDVTVPLGSAPLRFTWADGHYAGHLVVQPTLREDVYVSPMAFHTPDGWVGADSVSAQASGPVDAVTFSVTVLPLMALVWAGLWMGLLGMGLVLVAWDAPRAAQEQSL